MDGAQTTLGTDVMLQLGAYAFSVGTAAYQELTRTTEQRWASQDRYGQREALQSLGPGADAITLQGVIYPNWRGGTGQLDAMRALADQRQPQVLVDGLGGVHGRWVIERIEEHQSAFAAAGTPRRQNFSATLRKFDDQAGGAQDALAAQLGVQPVPPVASLLPAPLAGFTTEADASAAVGGLVGSTQTQAGTILGSLQGAVAILSPLVAVVGSPMRSALGAASRAVEAAQSLTAVCSGAATLLPPNATYAQSRGAAITLANGAGGIVNLAASASSVMQSAINALGAGGGSSSAISSVRGAKVAADQLATLIRTTAGAANSIAGRIPT